MTKKRRKPTTEETPNAISGLTQRDYQSAYHTVKNSVRDRIGILGDLSVVALGIGAGIGLSGAIAAAAGAVTIFGSATLGSLLGGYIVPDTPFSWIVGAAIGGGVIAFASRKMIHSGAKADAIKKQFIDDLQRRIKDLDANTDTNSGSKLPDLVKIANRAVRAEVIPGEKRNEILFRVKNGTLDVEEAITLLREILAEEASNLPGKVYEDGVAGK